jgi:hypothetical protein
MKSIKEILEEDSLFEVQASEPLIQEPIVSKLAKDFAKIAFQANLKRNENSISQRVKEEISRTALYLYRCKNRQTHKKLQLLHEIEEAYVRSSALMTFLERAVRENEISRSDFLHFEIQIKGEMQKMLMAIGKIMVGV